MKRLATYLLRLKTDEFTWLVDKTIYAVFTIISLFGSLHFFIEFKQSESIYDGVFLLMLFITLLDSVRSMREVPKPKFIFED